MSNKRSVCIQMFKNITSYPYVLLPHKFQTMSIPTCRSQELKCLDWFVFSVLFSRSLAYNYVDICACFVFFYISFIILHATRDDNICSQYTQTLMQSQYMYK